MKPNTEGVKEIESPTGLDLNPQPPSPVRLSKRAGILGLSIVCAVVAAIGFGVVTRGERPFPGNSPAEDEKRMTAATDAGKVIAAQIPARVVPSVVVGDRSPAQGAELRPPGQTVKRAPAGTSAGQTTGPTPYSPPATVPQYREPTPEEKRLAAAYELEIRALEAPTQTGSVTGSARAAPPAALWADSRGPQLASVLGQLQTPSAATTVSVAPSNGPLPSITLGGQTANPAEEYEAQNMQDSKERFLARARAESGEDYLNSTRTKPVGPYEIKAGWDIPAVLEQALNSDLPGEIKALVRENVYDTATGKYLLIPQGSRLVGTYDSRVGYGQNGIQVVWNRVIFPDASSISLDGMTGQDAGGLSGLRHGVDNHYKRLLGFGLLTSAFSAAFELSQSRRGTVLGYPSPGEIAGSSVGSQISQLGADVTRRNLNIQPTIKVPVGYRFNVRVNRDILFEAPYSPFAG